MGIRFSGTIKVIVTCMGVILLVTCKKNPQQPSPVLVSAQIIYVTPDGTGDGSPEKPLGSIQQALDSVQAGVASEIHLALGEYHESITIQCGVTISGGYSFPEWEFVSSSGSIIWKSDEDSAAITCYGEASPKPVKLNSIGIAAVDASIRGRSSYGIFCIGADLTLIQCTVFSGKGKAGLPGVNGSNGVAGDNAPQALWNGPPGVYPVSGGWGGLGGEKVPCNSFPGHDGAPGWCGTDSGSGGAGGHATGSPSLAGVAGANGVDGISGHGSRGVFRPVVRGDYTVVLADSGGQGTTGTFGCGGGGGAGGPSQYLRDCAQYTYHGASGGGGGAGGGPGQPGGGGRPGGSSIAVLLINSRGTFHSSELCSDAAGDGGDGGLGGGYGRGGYGGGADYFPTLAGNGGAGGHGGAGGPGGGGAGGSSAAIAVFRCPTNPVVENCSLRHGAAGRGGGHGTEAGVSGQANDYITF